MEKTKPKSIQEMIDSKYSIGRGFVEGEIVLKEVQKEIKKWIDDIQNDEEPYQNDVEILKKLHGGIKK